MNCINSNIEYIDNDNDNHEIISEPFSIELLDKLLYYGFKLNQDFTITYNNNNN